MAEKFRAIATHAFKSHGKTLYSHFVVVVVDVVRNCSMNAIKWGCVIKCGGDGEGESWDLVTIDGAPTDAVGR